MNTRALAELIAPACRTSGDHLISFFDEQGERQVRNPADHPLAFLLAEAIHRIHCNLSISALFRGTAGVKR